MVGDGEAALAAALADEGAVPGVGDLELLAVAGGDDEAGGGGGLQGSGVDEDNGLVAVGVVGEALGEAEGAVLLADAEDGAADLRAALVFEEVGEGLRGAPGDDGDDVAGGDGRFAAAGRGEKEEDGGAEESRDGGP